MEDREAFGKIVLGRSHGAHLTRGEAHDVSASRSPGGGIFG